MSRVPCFVRRRALPPDEPEFFFLNRIEARIGRDVRSTTQWDDVFNLRYLLKLEKKYVNGPEGFSE